jgi:DNA primase
MLPRIDIHALKRDHPLTAIMAHYGIDLRPAGRALVGRCPFHMDGGRPNLWVYPTTDTFYCYRCSTGGDVLAFIERIERLDFRAAVVRLAGSGRGTARRSDEELESKRAGEQSQGHARFHTDAPAPLCSPSLRPSVPSSRQLGLDEQACLGAAVELYHHRLLTDVSAMRYMAGRGIDVATVERYRLGYAAGDELIDFLRWRRLPRAVAFRAGLLGVGGRETMAGRVVVPELRAGKPIWLIGRTVGAGSWELGKRRLDGGVGPWGSGSRSREHSSPPPISHLPSPKYLGLPGRKPLLGWEGACGSRHVVVAEGVFDWLTLCQWGLPAVALAGTHARPDQVRALGRFARVYLALDSDEAGQRAAEALRQALGPRSVTVPLPAGVHDIADLAVRAGGRDLFIRCVDERVVRSAA